MEITEEKIHLQPADKDFIRDKIIAFQKAMMKDPRAVLGDNDLTPVEHHFADGVYLREMFVPAGTLVNGKIHNKETINILVSGTMEVVTEDQAGMITAPFIFVSRPGIMKIGFAHTDCIFINVHDNPKNIKNPEILEKRLVSSDYDQYQKAIEPSFFKRIIKLLTQ